MRSEQMKQPLTKNRILFWILLFLIVLNLGAFITWFASTGGKDQPEALCLMSGRSGAGPLKSELGLSDAQTAEAQDIMDGFRKETEPLAMTIRRLRGELITELGKDAPDTIMLRQMSADLSNKQVQLQMINARQFLALKKICSPEQFDRLSELYLKMHRCDLNPEGKGQMRKQRHRFGKEGGGKNQGY